MLGRSVDRSRSELRSTKAMKAQEFFLKRNLHSCDSDCRPFAPRSGEKVVRQHRMRGRGRWAAIDVAAERERNFIRPADEA